jgi:predicted RNA binding protein YcfA (HicA-like mRNA interferase family)
MAVSKELLRTVAKHGFTLVRSNKHLIFRHPCGAQLVTAASASDVRSIRNVEGNIRRILRRHGVEA